MYRFRVYTGKQATLFTFSRPTLVRRQPKATAKATASATATNPTPTIHHPQKEHQKRRKTRRLFSYVVKSPTKLRKQNKMLRLRLQQMITALHNARRREHRLQGTVSTLPQRLNDQKLLSDKANELPEPYSNIPLDLFRQNKRTYSGHFCVMFVCSKISPRKQIPWF